ncbi:tail fiber protein, partial [Salmonella enterica]|nr:tail fiber protein [Salmonella enterica]EJZ5971068.1 tail fiber protein [Salmonella enterica]
MKNIIDPVETEDGLFHDGDPTTGEEGTIVDAKIMNAIQGAVIDIQAECINVLAAAGFKPDPAKKQLLDAIKAIVGNEVPAASTTQAGTVKLSSATDSDSE